MSRYQYEPLVDKARDIRLLSLLPRTNISTNKLHVLIHHVKLDKNSIPDYEALSYAWGTEENAVTIYVGEAGEHVLEVTRNLVDALMCLRYNAETRVLWIDAICIDQQNLQERSQQVGRMADIFRLAPRTTAWLGPGDRQSKKAMALLSHLSTRIDVDWSDRAMTPSQDAKNSGDEAWADRHITTPYSNEKWGAILSLLSRSWFERLWIRQEIWLSQLKAILACGDDTISWADFCKSMFCLYYKNCALGANQAAKWSDLRECIYRLCSGGRYTSWKKLLAAVRTAKCSDPKDKVYGVLSLIPTADPLVIHPDYTKTHFEVYKDLALRYVDQKSKLDLLECCHLDDRDPQLPSWVPNLARKSTNKLLTHVQASGTSRCCAQLVDEGTLKVIGRRVATVKQGQLVHFKGDTDEEVIAVVRKLAPSHLDGTFVGGGKIFDAYGRVIASHGFFTELHWPPDPKFPDLEMRRIALRKFLDASKSVSALIPGLLPDEKLYLEKIYHSLHDLQFITTHEGYMGVGPPVAQAGDQVCVLLGMSNLILLRPHPSQDDRYEVVGEALMHGLMRNEGLLGSLPKPYEAARLRHKDSVFYPGFLNRETEEWHVDDPRLGHLPKGWVKKKHRRDKYRNLFKNEETGEKTRFDPRMTVQELTKRGVELEPLYLV
jgi:hypothetical protein